jgi:hypothetical protein
MTCHEVTQQLKQEGWEGRLVPDNGALATHLKSCHPCHEAMQVARLSSVMLGALREETGPGPSFYPRMRARLAESEISQPDAALLDAWGLARRLIPALAVGVVLLAGVTLSVGGSRSSLPVQVAGGTELYAFSLEEVNLPGVVGQPSRDQMLAFVLRQDDGRGSESAGETDRSPVQLRSDK